MRTITKKQLASLEEQIENELSTIPQGHCRVRAKAAGEIVQAFCESLPDDGTPAKEHVGAPCVYWFWKNAGSRRWSWSYIEYDLNSRVRESERRQNIAIVKED